MTPLIERHRQDLVEVGRRFGVTWLEVFGSVCTPEFDPERSDIDVLVDYPADDDFGPWLTRFHELQRALSTIFGRRADLVTTKVLQDPWFSHEAAKTRQVVCDAADIAQIA